MAFLVHFRPLPDVDPIKALRALLKVALRRFGLRAVLAEEIDTAGDDAMRLDKYAGESYLKPEDFEGGPEVKTIKSVQEGRYNKPDVTFKDHSKLSLNSTNVKTLLRLFGSDIEFSALAGQRIECYLGKIKYDGKDNPAVLIRAPGSGPAAAPPAPKPGPVSSVPPDDPSSDIPF
jgi:hypothetical protein